MNEPILQLENLSRRFGGVTAVGDVSVEFSRGAITGLIGPMVPERRHCCN